ncbi:MAG: hypothetical protein HY810_01000 [Candidatus Omnitrophica bacterium]|nr:hypothetical protein [Candidatus Omnitrophota bacterium]
MIDFPDDILISIIQPQNAHCDFTSVEPTTNKKKKKYKLAGKVILQPLNFYPFFILTSNKSTCQEYLTVCIKREEWADRNSTHLAEEKSYIDIKKIETLTQEEIIDKMRDPDNGFPCIAKLCDKKFEEIAEKRKNLHKATRLSSKTQDIINAALSEADIANNILKNLSLE